MRTLLAALAALTLTPALAAPAAAAPLQFVYRGAGCTGLAALPQFEAYMGHKVDGVIDFDDRSGWAGFDSAANWSFGCWKGKGYKLAYAAPLTVNGTSLAAVAAGGYDDHFRKLAQGLVSNGFPDAYVRLGWEFNGGWYPWAAKDHAADFIAAWRRVVGVMRSVPGQQFKMVWNPSQGEGQLWPDQAYPGDDVVDVIAIDAYDQSWATGALAAPNVAHEPNMWNAVQTDSWGLNQVIAFARTHSKPFAVPEWGAGSRPDGHGGGDDPVFVADMAALLKDPQTNAAFEGFWDFDAGDYNSQVSNGERPAAGAALKAAFPAPAARAAAAR